MPLENCGRAMTVKTGRRGRFLACTGYPECKTTKPLPIGVKCDRPGCEGQMIELRPPYVFVCVVTVYLENTASLQLGVQ